MGMPALDFPGLGELKTLPFFNAEESCVLSADQEMSLP